MKKLSVIIPTFNCSDKLKRTIASIKNVPSIEIIVIDDGSHCNESKKNQQICQLNDSMYFWFKNQGPSKARYEGLKRATSEYVLFLDSDDVISINAIKFGLNLLKEQENIDFITFKSKYVTEITIPPPAFPLRKTYKTSKKISQVLINIFGIPKQKTIGWNQSNTIYIKYKILSIYSCRNLSWGEDIPLKVKIIRNLFGISVDMPYSSLVEISYGRGYSYNFKQVSDLAKEMYNINENTITSTVVFLAIYLRYIPSMVYKKVKKIIERKS
ncbi:glycosyltransferase family 2 protein [Xenorhabdus sp. 42]|uniref:glycosyltransferase family A protein n=1 Tax=Xenorhabdus szentirmaii TaxID=290112 RepID=UPI00198EBAA9|nr:glycosyltransferase family 2 protein [Xenorhabdus sp. 42]MBD2820341.1 glycosyltransferase family 2 protein [Xenorhabdus sp. 42]